MTIPIGGHGLSCLRGDDYAAIPLWMQDAADSIDSSLSEGRQLLDSYRNRPWYETVNNSSIPVNNLSGYLLPEGAVGEVAPRSGPWTTFSNGLIDNTSNGSLPAGLYLAGSSVTWTVATPNNNTLRTLEVFGLNRINGNVSINVTYDILFQNQTLEASNGLNSLNVTGYIMSDGTLAQIVAAFYHSNTSSDLVVAAGNWRLWLMYMGSGLVI